MRIRVRYKTGMTRDIDVKEITDCDSDWGRDFYVVSNGVTREGFAKEDVFDITITDPA